MYASTCVRVRRWGHDVLPDVWAVQGWGGMNDVMILELAWMLFQVMCAILLALAPFMLLLYLAMRWATR